MFRNYLTTALRNLARHKLYSFINIFGLAVGLACAIFVILFIRDEISYDSWIPNSQNLYKLEVTSHVPGRAPLNQATVPFLMPSVMKDRFPEVVQFTRLTSEGMTINIGSRQFSDRIEVVDPQFLNVIQLPLLSGDPGKALSRPDSLVLSQRLAKKYFGDADPIGKTVTVSNARCSGNDESCQNKIITLTVTGLLRDLPHNTQLIGDALMPNTSLADIRPERQKDSWIVPDFYGFVVLAPGADPETVIGKMPPILDEKLATELKAFNLPMRGRDFYDVHLTPFAKVHLNSEQYDGNMTAAGSWATLYGLAIVSALIILIACFNYTNLATARAILRVREIGLRKCVGAKRSQLVMQFLGESVFIALLAEVLALAMVEILQPAFDAFLGRQISADQFHNWPVVLMTMGIAVAAGLIAGTYPALIVSGFRPAQALRGGSAGQPRSGPLRTALVVFQFAVSIGLGIAAIVVFSQIRFARNADLGFQHARIIVIPNGPALSAEARNSFAHVLLSNPGVLDVGQSSGVPFNGYSARGIVEVPGKAGQITPIILSIDSDFTGVYHIRLLAGQMLSRERGVDTFVHDIAPIPGRNDGHNIIINAAAAAWMGLTPQQAIGKTVIFNNSHVRIVGVTANIKFDGVREPVEPTVYYNNPDENLFFSIRVRDEGLQDTSAFIDRTWHGFAPATSSHRYFLDDSFYRLYLTDQRQGQMFAIFVIVAIVIACMGMFGLAAITVGRRTREIGIRKVFGARTRDLVVMLLWQFSIPVLISNAIAWPAAWYYLDGWLQGFAYRISLDPFFFLCAGAIALAIAWVTVFVHAYRVASANPIHALRYE